MPLIYLFILIFLLFLIFLIFLIFLKKEKKEDKDFLIEDYTSERSEEESEGGIPKIIYQTNEGRYTTKKNYDIYIHNKAINPQYSYQFFDADDRRNFIKDNFPQKVLQAYDKIIPKAYKADLFRYCVLYINGGVYMDCETTIDKPLDDIIGSFDFVSIRDWDSFLFKSSIHNMFIASIPNHPFLLQVINDCISNIENEYVGDWTFDITGPVALARAVNKVLGRKVDEKFNVGENYINGYKFKLLKHKSKPCHVYDKNDNLLLHKHYPLTLGKFANKNIHYSVQWIIAKFFNDPKHLYK